MAGCLTVQSLNQDNLQVSGLRTFLLPSLGAIASSSPSPTALPSLALRVRLSLWERRKRIACRAEAQRLREEVRVTRSCRHGASWLAVVQRPRDGEEAAGVFAHKNASTRLHPAIAGRRAGRAGRLQLVQQKSSSNRSWRKTFKHPTIDLGRRRRRSICIDRCVRLRLGRRSGRLFYHSRVRLLLFRRRIRDRGFFLFASRE